METKEAEGVRDIKKPVEEKTIRFGYKWIKKGGTKGTIVTVDNVLPLGIGGHKTVYFHSDRTGTHYQRSKKHFLEVYTEDEEVNE